MVQILSFYRYHNLQGCQEAVNPTLARGNGDWMLERFHHGIEMNNTISISTTRDVQHIWTTWAAVRASVGGDELRAPPISSQSIIGEPEIEEVAVACRRRSQGRSRSSPPPVAKATFHETEHSFAESVTIMLCEVAEFAGNSLVGIWMTINALMIVSIFASSFSCFYYLYWPSMVSYEKWRYKVCASRFVQIKSKCTWRYLRHL